MIFPESFIIVFVLASLPESFDTLVISLEARREDELTIEFVKQKLIDESLRKKEKEDTDEKMMYSRERKSFQRKSYEKRCFVCGKTGHLSYKHKQDEREKN